MHGARYADVLEPDLRKYADATIERLRDAPLDVVLEAYDAIDASWAGIDPALIAYLNCNDRFYLFTRTLKRRDGEHPWVYARCREVERDRYGYLDLWSRGHFKSSLITFSGTIQDIIDDPEVTIGIFSGTKALARPFLLQIKEEIERNETLLRFHPDVFWAEPRKQAPSWSLDGGITVRRTSNPREATVEAHGLIDAMPTGKHFKKLKYDDIIDEKLVGSPEMIKKATERWELSDNLGTGGATKEHAGTRYHFADTYGVMLERGILKPRIYPATHNGKLDGNPVLISKELWEEKKRTQRSTVAAQMLLNPLAGQEAVFEATWFRPYEVIPAVLTIYITVDPSKGRSASSDRTAIAVMGIDPLGNRYLLDGYRHRMSLSQRWSFVRSLWRKWMDFPGVQLVKVGWEQYGAQTDLEYVQERMRAEGVAFEIIELNWARDAKTQAKRNRVERLEPDFRQTRFWLPPLVYNVNLGYDCYWRVNPALEDGDISPESAAPILYRKAEGLTRQMRQMKNLEQSYRVPTTIRRRDEDGNLYDLTAAFFEEALFFPFAPKDDLVDAMSRLYDMEPLPPERISQVEAIWEFAEDA